MTFVNESNFVAAPSCAVSIRNLRVSSLTKENLRLVKPQNVFIKMSFYKKQRKE